MSGSHAVTAGDEVRARLQTLGRELQAHEAELNLTSRTQDVLAARFVVLHPLTAGGTGPDGGTISDPLHLREGGGLAVLQKRKVLVGAAIVVAAVRAWSWTFPRIETLPAVLVIILLVCYADCALHAEVSQVLSLHIAFAPGTSFEFTVFNGSQAGDGLFKVLHLFSCQHCQPAHLLIGPHFITLLQGAVLQSRALKFVLALVQQAATPPSERLWGDGVTAGHLCSETPVSLLWGQWIQIIRPVDKLQGRIFGVISFFSLTLSRHDVSACLVAVDRLLLRP